MDGRGSHDGWSMPSSPPRLPPLEPPAQAPPPLPPAQAPPPLPPSGWGGAAAGSAAGPIPDPWASQARRGVVWMVLGSIGAVCGAGLTVVGLAVMALTANSCGAFADSCDDYGETGDGFGAASLATLAFGGLTLLAIGAFVVGLVLRLRVASSRRRGAAPTRH